MSISGIQGQLLEVTVVGCNKLKDTEWISKQDPYVCVEYGSTKFRTRTCTDGGKNPTFQEKFVVTLIEGLREINVIVWNSNTLTTDDNIGTGKVQLEKVLSQGYDDSPWSLQDKRGKYSGEVRLILHFANANKQGKIHAQSAPQYAGTPQPQAPMYSAPQYSAPLPTAAQQYPPTSYAPQPQYPTYAPSAPGYPPSPYQQPASTYPPTSTYPSSYPPTSTYPTQTSYPPPQSGHSYYPPGSYPTSQYPRPPY